MVGSFRKHNLFCQKSFGRIRQQIKAVGRNVGGFDILSYRVYAVILVNDFTFYFYNKFDNFSIKKQGVGTLCSTPCKCCLIRDFHHPR